MNMSFTALADLMRLTLQDAKAGATRVLALPLTLLERWQALALVVVVSVILAQITQRLLPAMESDAISSFLGSPLHSGIIQGLVTVAMVAAVHFIGRSLGGTGTFAGALVLMAWLQIIMITLQLIQTVAMLLVPATGFIIFLIGMVLFFWLLTQFIMVLHGFRSAGKVFAMVLVSLFGLAFALSAVLVMTGVGLPGGV